MVQMQGTRNGTSSRRLAINIVNHYFDSLVSFLNSVARRIFFCLKTLDCGFYLESIFAERRTEWVADASNWRDESCVWTVEGEDRCGCGEVGGVVGEFCVNEFIWFGNNVGFNIGQNAGGEFDAKEVKDATEAIGKARVET